MMPFTLFIYLPITSSSLSSSSVLFRVVACRFFINGNNLSNAIAFRKDTNFDFLQVYLGIVFPMVLPTVYIDFSYINQQILLSVGC